MYFSLHEERLIPSIEYHEPNTKYKRAVWAAQSDIDLGNARKRGCNPSSKCTLSLYALGGPLIIYPYWTQFTLKLTSSRLVSLGKLTSKLTIYDRSTTRDSRDQSLLISTILHKSDKSIFMYFRFNSHFYASCCLIS